jgi:hypothetical protein
LKVLETGCNFCFLNGLLGAGATLTDQALRLELTLLQR